LRDEAEHKADSEAVEVGARRCRDAEGIKVLAVIHGTNAPGGIFEETVRAAGHEYDEWSLAWERPSPRPLEEYDAVLVFGGSMHADQDDRHPWLIEENSFIQGLLERHVPMLGVCLGIQLFAKAEGAAVYPLAGGPEIGWFPVELTEAAAADPLFARLPARFDAFGWHYYTYDLPERAVELGRSARCNQAFRLGENGLGRPVPPRGDARDRRGVVRRRGGLPDRSRPRSTGGGNVAEARRVERVRPHALRRVPRTCRAPSRQPARAARPARRARLVARPA
jgi:GMP synthase-like glutamine amidotransferase